MKSLQAAIPEIQTANTAEQIPWKKAVVWITDDGKTRTYEWLTSEHIQYVSWVNGNVSIIPRDSSILDTHFSGIVIQGKMVFVGKEITVS
ncbi:MAG: hypothetical protein PHW69_00030 [Elusimicrobiaceae bacterium]|nr:hypothetical protein [Elusimicrobiaceae bacterium]